MTEVGLGPPRWCLFVSISPYDAYGWDCLCCKTMSALFLEALWSLIKMSGCSMILSISWSWALSPLHSLFTGSWKEGLNQLYNWTCEDFVVSMKKQVEFLELLILACGSPLRKRRWMMNLRWMMMDWWWMLLPIFYGRLTRSIRTYTQSQWKPRWLGFLLELVSVVLCIHALVQW